jgi:hypothetical protein
MAVIHDCLYEAGVHYRRVGKPDRCETEFEYEWFHFPSGKTGGGSFITMKTADALKLVNHWNKGNDWKYVLKGV